MSIALLQFSWYDLYVHFKSICKTIFTEMSSNSQNEKLIFEVCDAETTQKNSVPYKKRWSVGTLYSTKRLHISSNSQGVLSLLLYFPQLSFHNSHRMIKSS